MVSQTIAQIARHNMDVAKTTRENEMTLEQANQVVSILEDSADRIEKHGWTQKITDMSDGATCAGITISKCTKLFENRSSNCGITILESFVYKEFRKTIKPDADLFDSIGVIIMWNDKLGRTVQEVLDALHKTDKRIRVQYGF